MLEKEILEIKKYWSKKENYTHNSKNIFKIIVFIIIIIFLINIIIISKYISHKYIKIFNIEENYFRNNMKLNNSKKIDRFKSNYYVSKTKYNEDIKYYKDILQLYIENRTKFYIKSREKYMKKRGVDYNDSIIITIQDKINWLTIHEKPEYKTNIVDKILLHEYSKKILGKDICVPILKIYNTSDEIDFNELPNKFVLKCNHGNAMNILCNNKSKLNIKEAKKHLDKWMKINYGLVGFEFQYLNIKRKIFAEIYLMDDIQDYKIYCFNGDPKFIRVQKYLSDHSIKINNYYNLDWTLNEIESGIKNYVRKPDIKFEKPKNLDLMIEYSKQLSFEFSFVRVDFYEVNNTIYLGEMTFTPSNAVFGCKDKNQSLYLGKMLDITKVKNLNNNNHSINFF